MGETLDRPMNVLQARQLLRNTRAAPEDVLAEAERVVRAFYATKPRRQCFVCPSGIWTEHETKAGDDVCWGCARCHTSADLTRDEIRDQQAERRADQQAAATAAEAAAAAQPAPRVILKQRLEALAQASSELARLEKAAPAARSRVWACQAAAEAAEAAAEEATAGAAAGLAEALAEGKSVGPSSAGAKARAALADAADALSLAKSARSIIEGKLTEAKSQVDFAFDKVRKAARSVIASERLEDLIGDAVEARANYLESVGALGWLVRSHAIDGDDRRPHQILGDANVPPSAWPEAVSGAGIQVMDAAMAALMLDAGAAI